MLAVVVGWFLLAVVLATLLAQWCAGGACSALFVVASAIRERGSAVVGLLWFSVAGSCFRVDGSCLLTELCFLPSGCARDASGCA